MARDRNVLWEIHLRITSGAPVSIACKRDGERLTQGVARMTTPAEALQLLETLLERFERGNQLFITARAHDSSLSMWSTGSKAAGLYWCAAALGQLWPTGISARSRSCEPRPSAAEILLGRAFAS